MLLEADADDIHDRTYSDNLIATETETTGKIVVQNYQHHNYFPTYFPLEVGKIRSKL
ncbi:MAG: hypothetical protein AAFO76_11255 [Cyanobacteria bacterium J06607_15]